MTAMKTRTGEEIRIFLRGNDDVMKEIHAIEEFDLYRCSIKSNLLHIIRYSIVNRRPRNLHLLLMAAIQRYLFNRPSETRYEVLDGCFGSVEMEFIGKRVSFPCGGFFAPLMLIKEVFMNNQYDVNKDNVEGKIVVDAGANVGVFSMLCACFGARKVYAFEPIEGTFEMLKENIRTNGFDGTIVPINKAIGNRNSIENIRYDYAGDMSSSLCQTGHIGKSVQKIEIVSLDSFIENERIGFIKIDVEGYEEMVLLGATGIIKRDKPVLSFSAYHKPTDLDVLPRTVMTIRPDYRIKMLEYGEKDLYCD